MDKMRIKKRFSFKKMTIGMIVICWIVPIIIIFATMSLSYRNEMVEKTKDLMSEEVKMHEMTMAFHINEVKELTKSIYYERKLEGLWQNENAYTNVNSRNALYNITGTKIMRKLFGNDWRIKTAFYYLLDNPDQIYPQTKEETIYYTEENRKTFQEVSSYSDAKIHVRVIGEQLYVLRNIYSISGYEKFATIVLVLDMDKILNNMSTSNIYDLAFIIGEDNVPITYKDNIDNQESKQDILNNILKREEEGMKNPKSSMVSYTVTSQNAMGFVYNNPHEDFNIASVLILDQKDLFSGQETIIQLIGGLLLIVIPIICFFIWYFQKNVTVPVESLVAASKEISKGQLGNQIRVNPNLVYNEEFSYLISSFNEMSGQIKYLFEYAYKEELARRDAQILALQSQINPHFLNNTLEMMNWQARMAGDVSVSKMIEALSTLLDHTMNRENKKLVSLAEEVRSADAYLYIISMRFGQRLQVQKNIDESLLQMKVPQLILQPILENAVVHGVESTKRGTIWINIYDKEKRIVMEVLNTGEDMTEEAQNRVNKILNGELEIKRGVGESTSLGIRNVNQRIQLIYGESFGLTVKPYSDKITAAVIEIPKDWEGI